MTVLRDQHSITYHYADGVCDMLGLSIETFNRHRPRWMPSFPSLSTSLGMTWKQMLAAAPQL